MHRVEPEVHVIAATEVDESALADYLNAIGARLPDPTRPDDPTAWQPWYTEAEGPEELVEVMSRSCYMSFGTELNPNITRVREGNAEHLANIIKSGHGSVLEHGWVSFMFRNVSRVFTNELPGHPARPPRDFPEGRNPIPRWRDATTDGSSDRRPLCSGDSGRSVPSTYSGGIGGNIPKWGAVAG